MDKERSWDKLLQIKTAGRDDTNSDEYRYPYEPTPYSVLERLVDKGNTVIVIEHNLDVIKMADYIIDMGPEGGKGGGEVLSCGTPEEVAMSGKGYTPKFLKEELGM